MGLPRPAHERGIFCTPSWKKYLTKKQEHHYMYISQGSSVVKEKPQYLENYIPGQHAHVQFQIELYWFMHVVCSNYTCSLLSHIFKMTQQENLNKLLFLFSTLKLALNNCCHYTNLFLSNNAVYLWNLKNKNICILDLPFKPLSIHWLAEGTLRLKSQ